MTDRAVEAATDAILDVPWTFYPTGEFPDYTAMAHAAVGAVRPIIEHDLRQTIDIDLYYEWERAASEYRRSKSDSDADYWTGFGEGLRRAQEIVEEGER